MTILLLAIIIALIAIAATLSLREKRPDPATIIFFLLAITACAGFTGFLFGDVRASYMGESIDRAIDETHKQLAAGHSDAVADAYEQAKQARASGTSAHESIGNIARSLRAIADATGDE